MQTILKYKYELILAIILIGFIAFQWNSLFLPYFWDELAYYSKAALYMYDNGLSLLPSGLPSDLSRGHPLLFQFLGGVWFKIFGTSLLVGHSLPFLISLFTLFFTYKIISKISNKFIGVIGTLSFAIQPLFFAQSTLILPEMLVTLLALLTIYFLIEENNFISLIFCTLLVITKETSVIIPISIFLYILIDTKKIKSAFPYLIPILILGVFFLIQKNQNGWFFFPFHVDIIAVKGSDFLFNIFKSVYFIFIAQFRFAISLFFLFQLYLLFNNNLIRKEKAITSLSFIIIIITIVIISGLHLMSRYYLMIFPLLIITAILGFKNIYNSNSKVLWSLPLMLLPLFSISSQSTFNMSADLGYKNCIKATQQLHKYIVNNDLNDRTGYCHFSILRAFDDSRSGFIDENMKFNLVDEIEAKVDYAIEINPSGWNRDLSHWNHFKLVKKIKEGNFEILIFEK